MTDLSAGPTDGTNVSGVVAILAIREGQEAEMTTITRCRTEIQAISVDTSLTPAERQSRIRKLQRLRNQANQALRDLEDDERSVVETSQYAKSAVDALNAATQQLNDAVTETRRISDRVAQVAGAIDNVTDAADVVLSRVGSDD